MRERKTRQLLSDEVKAKIGASQIRRITERYEWKRLTNNVFFQWAESIAEAARKGGTNEEELDWTSKNRVRLAEVGDMRRAKQAKTERQELLEWEPLTNKVFFSWAESIAEAARKGGMSEEELDWDSYNRMRREVSGELVRYFTIEGNRNRAKTAIEGGAANETEMLVGKKEQEQAAEATSEVNGETVQGRQNGNFGARESSLRARIAEISGKKSTDGKLVSWEEVTVSGHPSLDKIDLQSIEKVMTQKKVSLADQIRAAKSKRERSAGDEASCHEIMDLIPVWHLSYSTLRLSSVYSSPKD